MSQKSNAQQNPETSSTPPSTEVQQTIQGFRKRQQWLPFFLGGLAIALLTAGLTIVIISWVSGGSFSLFPTATPTASPTIPPSATPTITPTATSTPTITPTPTVTPTPVPSEPFAYLVQEGDTLVSIAEKFQADLVTLMLLNGFNNETVLRVGQAVLVPPPNYPRPTATPLPDYLPRGFEIQYFVLPGDTLAGIAARFNSTLEAIMEANGLDNPNAIYVGQLLIVPVNLVTPTPTATLSGPAMTATALATLVPPTETPAATATPTP